MSFFPGILEGLVGRLGLAPPGVTDPPTSVREGVAHHWEAILKEAIRRMEGRDINLGQVTSTMVPHRLHLDYDLDFRTRRVDDVAPALTSPFLPGLVGNLRGWKYLESPHPSRWMGTCGVPVGHFLSWMYPVHLMTRGRPPRDELVKGRLRRMSLLAKERALRISLLWSLTRRK